MSEKDIKKKGKIKSGSVDGLKTGDGKKKVHSTRKKVRSGSSRELKESIPDKNILTEKIETGALSRKVNMPLEDPKIADSFSEIPLVSDQPEGLSENPKEAVGLGLRAPQGISSDEDIKHIADYEEDLGEEEGGVFEKGVEHLIFSLGMEEYAIELSGIQEIIRLVDVTPVPRSNKNIYGIFSLRGTIIPLYDLRKRLGLGTEIKGRQTRILVVKLERGVIGLIADKVSGVVFIPDNVVGPPPTTGGGVTGEHLKGLATINDHLYILLNIERAVVLD